VPRATDNIAAAATQPQLDEQNPCYAGALLILLRKKPSGNVPLQRRNHVACGRRCF